MRIACPSCDAEYDVPVSRLKPGKMVRCARCGGEWVAAELEVNAAEAGLTEAPVDPEGHAGMDPPTEVAPMEHIAASRLPPRSRVGFDGRVGVDDPGAGRGGQRDNYVAAGHRAALAAKQPNSWRAGFPRGEGRAKTGRWPRDEVILFAVHVPGLNLPPSAGPRQKSRGCALTVDADALNMLS